MVYTYRDVTLMAWQNTVRLTLLGHPYDSLAP
jgi:hypothetical protein